MSDYLNEMMLSNNSKTNSNKIKISQDNFTIVRDIDYDVTINDPEKTITENSNSQHHSPQINKNEYNNSDNIKNLENINDENYKQGRWTKEEHFKFIKALLIYGNNWKKVQNYIGSRSPTQARSHAQKFFIRIHKKICKDIYNENLLQNELYDEIKDYVINEVLRKQMNLEMNYEEIKKLEKKEKLSRVIFSVFSNNKSGKNTQNNISSYDDISIELSDIKEMRLPIQRSNKSKADIFKIKKFKKNLYLEDNKCFKKINPALSNQLINQSHNSFVNIFNFNFCNNDLKNDKHEKKNENVEIKKETSFDCYLENYKISEDSIKNKNEYELFDIVCNSKINIDEFIENKNNFLDLYDIDNYMINSFFYNNREDELYK